MSKSKEAKLRAESGRKSPDPIIGGNEMNGESYSKNPFMYIHKQLEEVSGIVINVKLSEAERQIAMRKRKLLLEMTEFIRDGALDCDSGWGWGWGLVAPKWEREYLYSLTIKGYAKTCEECKIELSSLVSLAQDRSGAICYDLGFNLDEMLANNEIDEAEETFRSRSKYDSSKPFAEYVRKALPKAENVSDYAFVSLEDMEAEFRFLYRYSSKQIRQQISRLKARHLEMLMYILEEEDIRYAAEQGLIISFLSKSECDVAGLIRELRKLR